MTDTEKATPMQTVNWKLPTRIASDNAGDWTPLREHLAAWAESGEQLDVEPDPLAPACLRMPTEIVEALDREAKRLTKKNGKRYTAGLVARLVWDEWEPSS
jgi:hypothetical protein